MSRNLSDLVQQAALRLHPPIVSVEEYRAIQCNRCGVCCEDIRAMSSPQQLQAEAIDPATDPERRRFLSGLDAVGPVDGAWRYRCRHFTRDADGLGLCTIHETRPSICRGFPYGHIVRSWPQCAWNVEVRDVNGRVITFVPPLETSEV